MSYNDYNGQSQSSMQRGGGGGRGRRGGQRDNRGDNRDERSYDDRREYRQDDRDVRSQQQPSSHRQQHQQQSHSRHTRQQSPPPHSTSSAEPSQLTAEAEDVINDASTSHVVLFIRNLPKDISGKQLMFSLFAEDGDHILSVNIHKHSSTGESLGTAEVIVDSIDVAQRLVYRYHNAVWDNQTLKLSILTDESVQHTRSEHSTMPVVPPVTQNRPVYSSIVTQPVSSRQQQKLNRPPVQTSQINIPSSTARPSSATASHHTNGSSRHSAAAAPPPPVTDVKKRLVISKNGRPIGTAITDKVDAPAQRRVVTKAQKHDMAKNTISLSSGKTVVKRSRDEASAGPTGQQAQGQNKKKQKGKR